jgi:hypothetical protein
LAREIDELSAKVDRLERELGNRNKFSRELFHNWHRARDGTIGRRTFLKHHHRVYAEFHEALDKGTRSSDRAAAGLCTNRFHGFENLWPFANDPQLQIEPTNNAAERAL